MNKCKNYPNGVEKLLGRFEKSIQEEEFFMQNWDSCLLLDLFFKIFFKLMNSNTTIS